MGSFSNYLENKLLDHTFKNTSFTSPTTVYLALYTSDPTDADTGTEVSTSGTAYARVAITFGSAASGSISNSADIVFATATGSYGTVSHFGIRDTITGGNLLAHGSFTSAQSVSSGQRVRVDANNLTVTLD